VTVALAVIELAFDPFLRVQGLVIPWRAVGIAGSVLVALLVAAVLARRAGGPARADVRADAGVEAGGTADDPVSATSPPVAPVVEVDDLLYIAVGAVPGAVVLGRLLHGLTYLDVYQRDPMALLDPARGSLSLLGAVVGGALTAAYVAATLGVSVRRCADIAAVPLLLSIGLGKLSQLLAGAGQGGAFDGAWAVAFTGPGPWMSVAAAAPAHPSQAYEGLWALLGVPLVLLLRSWSGRRPAARRDAGGALFLVALSWWLVGRIAAGFTWRDDPVVGPLNAEQVLAVGVLAAAALALSAAALSARRSVRAPEAPADAPPPAAEAVTSAADPGGSVADRGGATAEPGGSAAEQGRDGSGDGRERYGSRKRS
jgi:prolipoprotein diacylglyceryltransferase